MTYIEVDIPKAPENLSLLETAAYELLRSRLENDDDPGEALEQATPDEIEKWLVTQAESLGSLFAAHAEHFEPDPMVHRH